jgi:polyisoprenoid-binding protein YceI
MEHMLYGHLSTIPGGMIMKPKILALFIAVFILAIQPSMAQSTWTIDPAHSLVQFQVKHLMISNVHGNFNTFSGKIVFDGKNYASVQAEATIDVASINTREPKRDDHLRSADFFDAAAYPKITFKSKRMVGIRGNRFKLVGDLTMHGITKEIVLNVEATPIVKGMQGESRIGVQAIARVNRQDYSIKWNRSLDSGGVVVSDEVQITLDLELTQPASEQRKQ